MRFGAIIIGDEILSGKRQDKHMAKAIELLGARGLELGWCHYLGDDPDLITATLRRTPSSSSAAGLVTRNARSRPITSSIWIP